MVGYCYTDSDRARVSDAGQVLASDHLNGQMWTSKAKRKPVALCQR